MRFILILLIITCIFCQGGKQNQYQSLEGVALGTSYHISFDKAHPNITDKQIDSLFHLVNRSLSTYIANSDISKINKGDTSIVIDALFKEVFHKSKRIHRETQGAFDPTIGILVNAWGFGPSGEIAHIDSAFVDSMLVSVGLQKIKLVKDKIVKQQSNTYLDFNAIAKGFAVDVLGRFLESNQVENYMVEIGGEIRVRGLNSKGDYWMIGIEEPNFDGSRSVQNKVKLHNESIATSGNYRKFKVDQQGNRYAHTINPHTGYPSKSTLLSASVIADKDCADVDAYATAFMSMGLEDTKAFLELYQDLKVFLIYSDKEGEIKTFKTNNLVLEP